MGKDKKSLKEEIYEDAIHFVSEDEAEELAKEHPVMLEAIEIVKAPEKNHEEKEYIVFFIMVDDYGDYEQRLWEIKVGRTSTYEFVKSIIEDIDIHNSKVLVEDMTLQDAGSVYEFCKYMQNFYNDGFDVEDYNQVYPGETEGSEL